MDNTTTAEQFEHTTSDASAAAQRAAAPVFGAVQQVWYVGLGVLAVAGEQTWNLLHHLAQKGQQVQPTLTHSVTDVAGDVGAGVKNLARKVARTREGASANLDEKINAAVQRLGLATRADIQALESRITDLSAKIEGKAGNATAEKPAEAVEEHKRREKQR